MTENKRFVLVFAKTGSINSGTDRQVTGAGAKLVDLYGASPQVASPVREDWPRPR
jgi:hypothetical protein